MGRRVETPCCASRSHRRAPTIPLPTTTSVTILSPNDPFDDRTPKTETAPAARMRGEPRSERRRRCRRRAQPPDAPGTFRFRASTLEPHAAPHRGALSRSESGTDQSSGSRSLETGILGAGFGPVLADEPCGNAERGAMQLTRYSDYSLRVLIYLAANKQGMATTQQIATAYGISLAHLTKVVKELASRGYVETIRGRSGGMRLAVPADEILIGEVVRSTEGESRARRVFPARISRRVPHRGSVRSGARARRGAARIFVRSGSLHARRRGAAAHGAASGAEDRGALTHLASPSDIRHSR
jgi:Rrf2 family protein